MRALAARFPGALRELDRLPMAEIERRIERLEAGERPAWARTLVAYHAWMRVALRLKRALPRSTDSALADEWLRTHYRPGVGEPSLAALDPEALEAILRPPGGRLSRWVLGRIAREQGIPLERVVAEAFDTGQP
ncbi:MAG: hypothetical protein KC619_22395 [Myxococcales bacterium]|nr:hypothetical protein [Myxococcales bacterium]